MAVSLGLAITVASLLEASYQPTIINPFQNTSFFESPQQEKFNLSTYLLPSYFSSAYKIYACQCSPYATAFQTFEVWLSLDNRSWVEIPFLNRSSMPSDLSQYADLGFVAIDNPTTLVIYGRCFLPEQNLTLPSGVSMEQVLSSVQGQILFVKSTTPRDQVLEILIITTLFLAFLQIIRFLREEWNKKELSQKEGQNLSDAGKKCIQDDCILVYQAKGKTFFKKPA
jgi:hypothetical protein